MQVLVAKDNSQRFNVFNLPRNVVVLSRHSANRKHLRDYYCRHDIAYLQPNDIHACVRLCVRERAPRELRYSTCSLCRCRKIKKTVVAGGEHVFPSLTRDRVIAGLNRSK